MYAPAEVCSGVPTPPPPRIQRSEPGVAGTGAVAVLARRSMPKWSRRNLRKGSKRRNPGQHAHSLQSSVRTHGCTHLLSSTQPPPTRTMTVFDRRIRQKQSLGG